MPVTDAAPDTLADLPRLLRDAEGFADVAVTAFRSGSMNDLLPDPERWR